MPYTIKHNAEGKVEIARMVPPGYQPEQGETVLEGDRLPEIETLHTPEYLASEQMRELREERTKRLRETDYTQLADAPFDPAQVADFATYRQALRDLPSQTGIPAKAKSMVEDKSHPDWPVLPTA